MTRFFIQLLLFCIFICVLQVIVSLDWEIKRSSETGKIQGMCVNVPVPYKPEPEVTSIQRHKSTHPELGFLWKPCITQEDNVVIGWGDTPPGSITTDSTGFANTQDAIATKRDKEDIDIIGFGASYMEGAQNLFHEYFSLKGYNYYNLSHGRYTLPQYNIALKEYGLDLNPKWAVYGLNEVSFTLIPDFEKWQESDMDWFEFHSGTWCGPAAKAGFPHNVLREFPRLHRTYKSTMKKTFRGALQNSPSQEELVDKSKSYIIEADRVCRENGINFILLLIPSKTRMINGEGAGTYLFSEMVQELKKRGITVIDLRDNFSKSENPERLYYKEDAHWNRTGVYRAAQEILKYIKDNEQETGGHD
ncbi:MAG: alginate O-acetyltransferase AlgX-related protein [Chitinivibrionales bacterium]